MPENNAKVIFTESLNSLMAHTIRALFNHYYKKGIVVDVLVIADTANAILPRSPTPAATSMLRTHLAPSTSSTRLDRVTAWIFIHKDANRHLARICIAHEVYHLVMELNAYIAGNRNAWSQIHVTKTVEDDCNLFARRICGYHDRFNRDESLRGEYIYFPEKIVHEVVKTNSTNSQLDWPSGVALDPKKPFHKTTPPSWLSDPGS